MNTKYIAGALLIGASVLTSCSDFTEIDAKGKNILSRTSDLELLLNTEYSLGITDLQEISGDIIYANEPLASKLQPAVKTQFSIIVGWDEAGHDENLPELTSSDSFYAGCYEYIGRIANPILSLADEAEGSESDKRAIKAEAYVIRAYFHFLAVQKFAPAYDKATAANTMAISYVKEDQDIKQPTVPISLQDYYTNIISDLDAAISIDEFPDTQVNQMRFGKACAYAIKALALMSMQEDDLAARAAHEALGINGTVANYNDMLVASQSQIMGTTFYSILRPKMQCAEDYFADYNLAFYETVLRDDMFEAGHTMLEKLHTMNMEYGEGMDPSQMMLGVPGLRMTYDRNSSWPAIGLRTSQMYLILAENAINNDLIDDAMDYLDQIRIKRIDPAVYAPLKGSVNDKATAIQKLKMTAHGEGLLSVWNFIDRKRWTRLPDYKETLTRDLAGVHMTLTPDSKMWVFPIPQNVINNNPNFEPYLN